MSRYRRRAVCLSVCLSSVVCRLSVTFVDCGQTATDRVMISSQSDRGSTWLHQAPNSVEIGLAVFEQWHTIRSGPTLCPVLQTLAPASKRCEVDIWLLWNTNGNLTRRFQIRNDL